MATNSGAGPSHGYQDVSEHLNARDPQNVNRSEVNDELRQLSLKDMVFSWTKDNMDISMAFKEIVANDPNRHKELLNAVNKTFEETSESIGPEEFQSMLGNLSFLKNKKNVANLYATLQSQFNNRMGSSFKRIIDDENVCELFTEKNGLNIEEQKKYSVDDERSDLENTLRSLSSKIEGLEESNEVYFNLSKFNKERSKLLILRVTNLLEECEVNYAGNVKQSEVIRKEIVSMLKED